jgi:hypothetical protein
MTRASSDGRVGPVNRQLSVIVLLGATLATGSSAVGCANVWGFDELKPPFDSGADPAPAAIDDGGRSATDAQTKIDADAGVDAESCKFSTDFDCDNGAATCAKAETQVCQRAIGYPGHCADLPAQCRSCGTHSCECVLPIFFVCSTGNYTCEMDDGGVITVTCPAPH